MDTKRVPPLGKGELLVVKPEVWEEVLAYIETQVSMVSDLISRVELLEGKIEQQHAQIKTIAKGLGGIYEED